MSFKNTTFKAFTLVEILIVIAILAILAVITLAALNPAARIAAANDSQSRSTVEGVCKALSLFIVDNQGALPTTSDPSAGSALPAVTSATIMTAGVDVQTIEDDLSTYGITASAVTNATGGAVNVGNAGAGQITCGTTLTDTTVFTVTY